MKPDLLEISDDELIELYKIISNYVQELEKMKDSNDWWN